MLSNALKNHIYIMRSVSIALIAAFASAAKLTAYEAKLVDNKPIENKPIDNKLPGEAKPVTGAKVEESK